MNADEARQPIRRKDDGKARHVSSIFLDNSAQSFRATVRLPTNFGLLMQPDNRIDQGIDKRRHQPPFVGKQIQGLAFIEAAHAHCPLQRLSCSIAPVVQLELSRRLPPNDAEPEVDVGSSSTIEPHLGFTGAAPRIQGREIEKGIADRALHLVSAVAHKKDLGHVRAEPLYLLPTMGGRIREKIEDLLLILAAHGVTRIVSAKLTPS